MTQSFRRGVCIHWNRPIVSAGPGVVGCPGVHGLTSFLERRCAMIRKTLGYGMALVVLVIALWVFGFRPEMQAQQPATPPAAGAKFTVIDSDATNLIVVDNKSNTLY